MRKMRRSKQQLSDDLAIDVLSRGTHGVLALEGDEGYPYAVPLSYVYARHATDGHAPCGRLYFHSAVEGHKIDAIQRNEKASFCVVDADEIVPEEYTTYFRSVIAFGRVHLIEKREEKLKALRLLGLRYREEDDEMLAKEIESGIDRVAMIEFCIERLDGKEARELVRDRKAASA